MLNETALSREEFSQLVSTADVLHYKNGIERIFQTSDAQIIKYFNGKKGQRKALQRVKRFARHAARLKQRKIITADVGQVYRLSDEPAVYLSYDKLAGESLEKLLAEKDTDLINSTVQYIIALHTRGVYFRDFHPGNILYDKNIEQFALIDVQNVNLHWGKVSFRRRVKNLATFFYNRTFKDLFSQQDIENILMLYLQASGFSTQKSQRFKRSFQMAVEKRKQLLDW